MAKEHLDLGKHGEEAAVSFLKRNGYRILRRNYRSRLGEIDIIGKDKDTFCFVEVKTRSSDRFGFPQEAVSVFKRRQIAKTALIFLKENKLLDKKARFDVVSLVFTQDSPRVELIKNAFELDEKFTY